jgi:hypothetical protein
MYYFSHVRKILLSKVQQQINILSSKLLFFKKQSAQLLFFKRPSSQLLFFKLKYYLHCFS